jgi:Ca-activated chloride channel family protein
MTCLPDQPTQQVPVPLKHTDVHASIAGSIASVEVTQQFFNPFSGKIEAVYVFPLPENAAVNDFIMTVGDRRIRGIIREREQAQQIYQEARAQGYVASILTEERPNIFTQKVANIEPGKQIDISIRYFNTLSYSDGEFEFAFPMVVGPRFNPPYTSDGVYARGAGMYHQGIWNDKATETQYLRPDQRSGHDISMQVAIDAGATPIESINCKSHAVDVQRASSGDPGKAVVTLRQSDSIPNKDFVLRYKLAGDGVRTSVVAYQGEQGGYFSMMLVPPPDLQAVARRPLEMVFVLDCSGSMSGEPLAQAKQAIARALKQLDPNDTFQVIRFSNNASSLGPAPIAATQPNIRRGLDYLESLNSEGGTMMIEGINAALDFPHDPSRLRFVCFLTDGYIGNESDILAAIQQKLGPTRIFSFGIGSSVNRYLMDSMARLGRGAVSYLAAGDSASDVMDAFISRISRAPMTDIRVEFDGLAVNAGDVFPSRIPDLFAGRPVMISGRFQGGPALRAGSNPLIRVSGNIGGERRTITVPVRINANDAGGSPAALAAVWARHKIADLADAGAASGPAEVAGNIKQVALQYGLMSPYTAFLAVDSSTRTEGSYGTTVATPVPVPEGVRYDTTVSERSPYR